MKQPTRREAALTDEVMRIETGCLPAAELVAYREGTIRAREREMLEAHLPGCEACRAALEFLDKDGSELVEEGAIPRAVVERLEQRIAEASRDRPSAGASWMRLAAGLLVAASVAAAVYLWLPSVGFDEDLGSLRGADRLEALEPVGQVASVPERFRWSPHPLARAYRVELLDGEMESIWSGRTGDDATFLDVDGQARAALAVGGRFSWQVVALDRKDLAFDRSAVVHFEIAPATPTR